MDMNYILQIRVESGLGVHILIETQAFASQIENQNVTVKHIQTDFLSTVTKNEEKENLSVLSSNMLQYFKCIHHVSDTMIIRTVYLNPHVHKVVGCLKHSYNDAGVDVVLFIGIHFSLQLHPRVIICKRKQLSRTSHCMNDEDI